MGDNYKFCEVGQTSISFTNECKDISLISPKKAVAVVPTYRKTCVKNTENNYRLMQVKSNAECSKGSILKYFRPSLSYQLSLRSVFCLFLSCCFTQVFLLNYNSRY